MRHAFNSSVVITCNQQSYSQNSLYFQFIKIAIIESIQPNIIDPTNQTQLTVYGQNFWNQSSVWCVFFLRNSSPFEYFASSIGSIAGNNLTCNAQNMSFAMSQTVIMITISWNMQEFGTMAKQLIVLSPPIINATFPQYLPTHQTNTLFIVGNTIKVGLKIYCRFNNSDIIVGKL